MGWFRALLAVCLLLSAACPAIPQSAGTTAAAPAAVTGRSSGGKSRLQTPVPVPKDMPAKAIGLIEFADNTICSGSVVGPDVVLTSAHCLFDEDRRRLPVKRFRAGFDRGRSVVDARVVATHIPRRFDPERFLETNDLDGYDWAFLRLDRKVDTLTGILPVHVLSKAEMNALAPGRERSFRQIGYGASDGHYPSMLAECHIVEWWDDNTFAHNCGTVPGDSGSPDLILEDGIYKIVGIESADIDTTHSKGIDMVVGSGAFARELERYLRRKR